MEVQIGTIRIVKNSHIIELTLEEAKDLYWKLNIHFGVNQAGLDMHFPLINKSSFIDSTNQAAAISTPTGADC